MIEPLPSDIFKQGQVLNNTYEIEGVLGRGGTGEVYRARNTVNNERVAIKALNGQFSGNADYVELMKREEEMRNIRNDAVVQYFGIARSDRGDVFLLMDYIDGQSMSDIMLDRRMDGRELMIVAHRVAEGLVAAHNKGIVHRDLSPDNVILRAGNPERATIIDFGIAKDTAAGARTIVGNEFAGKYEYAAPEQLDGKAEKRSDFYALGATLLASYRGQIPFAGSTPGEIVRRKQARLDTDGVPEPLKGLIDWLCAPDLVARPERAEDILVRLEQGLKPTTARSRRSVTPRPAIAVRQPRKRRSGWLALVLPLLLIAAGAGSYYAGLLDQFFPQSLPVASPYVLTAQKPAEGAATLSGDAPDTETAALLIEAFTNLSGTTPPESALAIANGMPSPNWALDVAGLLFAMKGLEEWSVKISDQTAEIDGLAPSAEASAAITEALKRWKRTAALVPSVRIITGPKLLPAKTVIDLAQPFATCGDLIVQPGEDGTYALGDTITITGTLASTAEGGALQSALESAVGDRSVRIEATVLNEDLCTVRRVMPPVLSDDVSVWLGFGDTGAENVSGVYRVGDRVTVEVHTPVNFTNGSLWVVLVNNNGKVIHLLPNIHREDNDLATVAVAEPDLRRVYIVPSGPDPGAVFSAQSLTVDQENIGKAEIVAFLSRRPLFAVLRPSEESVASFAEALARVVKEDPENILAIASRLLDSRP